MGYRRAKTLKLTWADGEFAGLEVRVRRTSVEQFLELGPLMEGEIGTSFSPEDVKAMRGLFLEFGRLLHSWNLEDEDTGQPIECTPEEFLRQDLVLVNEIIRRYGEYIAGVSAPLPQPSPGGEPPPEASLPMEPLSPSPRS